MRNKLLITSIFLLTYLFSTTYTLKVLEGKLELWLLEPGYIQTNLIKNDSILIPKSNGQALFLFEINNTNYFDDTITRLSIKSKYLLNTYDFNYNFKDNHLYKSKAIHINNGEKSISYEYFTNKNLINEKLSNIKIDRYTFADILENSTHKNYFYLICIYAILFILVIIFTILILKKYQVRKKLLPMVMDKYIKNKFKKKYK